MRCLRLVQDVTCKTVFGVTMMLFQFFDCFNRRRTRSLILRRLASQFSSSMTGKAPLPVPIMRRACISGECALLACRVRLVLAMTSLPFRHRYARSEPRDQGAPTLAADQLHGVGSLAGHQHVRAAPLKLLRYVRADAQRPDSPQFERPACLPKAASVPLDGIDGWPMPWIRG